jgi:two-component system OmpR family sensor kinase
MDGKQRMKIISLRKRLLIYLLIAMLVSGLAALATAFYFNNQDAKEFQDKTLSQIGQLSLTHKVIPNSQTQDSEYRITLYVLSENQSPQWLSSNLKPGFYTLSDGEQNLRVWIGETKTQKIAVTQPTSEQVEIVYDSTLRTLIPLLILLPLMGLVVWLGVTRSLKSVETLAQHIDGVVEEVPEHLPAQNIPIELQGFISAINSLLRRLQAIFIRQQRFIADAAHELRTPLTALSLQVQNLSQAKTLAEVQKRLVPLQKGVERGKRLTEQLLDLNRSQVQNYAKSPIDLHTFMLELLSLYWPAAEKKSQELILECPETLTLNSNSQALTLILGNGLDNAIKYSPEHSEITLRVVEYDNSIAIQIEDQGTKLSSSQIAQVFEPFVRLDESQIIGNGLGLAIAQSTAKQLGALLSLENNTCGIGLVFKLIHMKQNS